VNIKIKRYKLIHYLFGALPARLGDEMSGQVILLLSLAITGSAATGSSLLAGLTFSAAVGGPILGAVLDRSQYPSKVLSTAIAMYAGGLVAISALLGHTPTALVLVLAIAIGFFMPSISGGWSSRLKSFSTEEQMTRASVIDATTFNIAGLAGPALAGLIAAWLGVGWSVAILAGLLVAALPMAWLLPHRSHHAVDSATFTSDILSGFKVIIVRQALLRITLLSVVSYFGIGMLWVIYPLVGKELFGNAGYGGLLASVLSLSALVATIAYAKWPTRCRPDTIAFATTLILGSAMTMLLLAGNIPLALAAMLIAGLADGPQLAAIFAVRHREAPERSRSQVFTTGASLKITAAAAGTALAGHLNSLETTIIVAASVQLAAAMSYIFLTRLAVRPT
jgi:MFS family permease